IHKRIAELLERFGDREGALAELERAASLAPDDAETWLAWLDLSFATGDLARAVALVRELLRRLPMGDAAFAATARRGADAALAIGDDETAIELLDEILERTPDDESARARRDEVLATTTDPERRVDLLARVAARNSGTARVEALDERARLLAEALDRPDEAIADLAAAFDEAPERTDLAQRLAQLLASAERVHELAELLRRLFPRERGTARRLTLRWLAHVLRDHLYDLPRAEQALRMALEPGDEHDFDHELDQTMRLELADLLERQGRWVDLAHELQRELMPELSGVATVHPVRIELLSRLARLQREVLDDDEAAARIYERLAELGHVPDEGLACLARAHRRAGRHAELVRVLELRASALQDDPARWAALQQHVAELLDGPLARPLEAAERYLAAFLADPQRHAAAIRRARVLLSGAASLVAVRERLEHIAARVDGERRAEIDTLFADVLANHPDQAEFAVERYRAALAVAPRLLSALEGLGRVELRRGDLEAAIPALLAVSEHPQATAQQRADAAASAARALVRSGREPQALAVLSTALRHSPSHARVLLELAQIYEHQGRATEQSVVLENLRSLALPGALRAEVLHRHAALLQPAYRADPRGREAEAAIADVLEALTSDPTHPGARQLLLELARLRNEWPLTVQALSAALRPLGPGPTRARVELDIADVLLDEGRDPEGAMQRLDAAIVEIDDDEIERRSTALALRLDEVEPLVGRVAERIRAAAERTRALEPDARARVDRLVARLHASREARAAAPPVPAATTHLPEDPREAITAMLRNAMHGDPAHVAEAWLKAAALVWQRLRDADSAAQHALAALDAGADEESVAALLGDVALSCTDAMALRIHDSLQSLQHAGASLRLQRAQLARLLGRSADALAELTELVQHEQGEIRHRALAELDRLLAQVAAPHDRLPVLRMRVAELSPDDEAEIADGAAELAAVELATGDATRALATCRLGLAAIPEHRTLLRMQVELLEHHDLPEELAL
ncbi:MAG TPA: tetratricopeptide repeat protein, partial [Nannocystaceae bacterium]|nr:tetratricopeptide repeat protein [Nannocystaceae bacterium]